jgi:hypothetical protein
MLRCFVTTADLDKVYAAAGKVLASDKVASLKLTAYKYYFLTDPSIPGLAGGRGRLSAWRLWDGGEETHGIASEALRGGGFDRERSRQTPI